jgi:hypothetical protein
MASNISFASLARSLPLTTQKPRLRDLLLSPNKLLSIQWGRNSKEKLASLIQLAWGFLGYLAPRVDAKVALLGFRKK